MTFRMKVDVHHHLPSGVPAVKPRDLSDLEAKLMSTLSDEVAKLRAAIGETRDRVTAKVADLLAQVADLKQKVADGSVSQADIDSLEVGVAELGQIGVDQASPPAGP